MKSAREWMEQLDSESHTTEPGVTEIDEDQIRRIQADVIRHWAQDLASHGYAGWFNAMNKEANSLDPIIYDTPTRDPQ